METVLSKMASNVAGKVSLISPSKCYFPQLFLDFLYPVELVKTLIRIHG